MGGSPFVLQLLASTTIILLPAFAGSKTLVLSAWGLHPRLYAYACSARRLKQIFRAKPLQPQQVQLTTELARASL
jgi:hypothetical protein